MALGITGFEDDVHGTFLLWVERALKIGLLAFLKKQIICYLHSYKS
jgi:hypothetical protein